MTGLITAGESLALIYTRATGGLDVLSEAAVSYGGAESNVAIAAARLEADASWIGRIGDDAFGRRIVRSIRGEGITVHGVVDDSVPTAMMVKDRPSLGRTRVLYYRSGNAGSRLQADDLPRPELENAKIFHFTGISLALSEEMAQTVLTAAKIVRDAGGMVSFDLNYRSTMWSAEAAGPAFREAIAISDIVFAGDDEAAIAVGKGSVDELTQRIAALGPDEIIIKLGDRGAYARQGDEVIEQAPFLVEVADTVGAGDAFVGGYLAEHLAGLDLTSRMRTAAAAGACACRGDGDWEMMPTRRDIAELMAGGDPVSR
jgi:2-dehydro-3-deoxygluconokinase